MKTIDYKGSRPYNFSKQFSNDNSVLGNSISDIQGNGYFLKKSTAANTMRNDKTGNQTSITIDNQNILDAMKLETVFQNLEMATP